MIGSSKYTLAEMSDRTSMPTLNISTAAQETSRARCYEPGHPIEFSTGLAAYVEQEVRLLLCKGPLENDPPDTGDPNLDGEIKRFAISLMVYDGRPGNPISTEYLLAGLRKGPQFITELKKLRMMHIIKMKGDYVIVDPSDLEKYNQPFCDYKSVGDIYNYRFYFFWSQSDEEDWRNYFEPIEPLSQNSRKEFYDTVLKILPDVCPIVDEREVISATGSIALNEKGLHEPHWSVSNRLGAGFAKETTLRGENQYIQKCPGDTRDILILHPDQSNVVRLIEKQVAEICTDVRWSMYGLDNDAFEERLKEFFKPSYPGDDWSNYYYNRDIKKDGITKPRELVQLVLSAIKEKYPHLPACKYFHIFNDFHIKINGEWHNPDRGVGLGMSAAITTIIQSAILDIILTRMVDQDLITGNVDAAFYHDDASIKFVERGDADNFIDFEDGVFQEFRLIRQNKKSYLAPHGVLCERYISYLDNKEAYFQVAQLSSFCACNITHAKEMFSSSFVYDYAYDEGILGKLVDYWGYEFFPDEASAPYQFGGWVPAYLHGIDIALWRYGESWEEQRAAVACQSIPLVPKHVRRPKGRFTHPMIQYLGEDMEYTSTGYSKDVPCTQVARDMTRMRRPNQLLEAYESAYKKRQEHYHRRLPALTRVEFFDLYRSLHHSHDILPPPDWGLVEEEDEEVFAKGEIKNRPTNILMSMLAYENVGHPSVSNFLPWYPAAAGKRRSKRLTAEERFRIKSVCAGLPSEYSPLPVVIQDHKRLIPPMGWKNSSQVHRAWTQLTGRFTVPILDKEDEGNKWYVENLDRLLLPREQWIVLETFMYRIEENVLPYIDDVMDIIDNEVKLIHEEAEKQLITDYDDSEAEGTVECTESYGYEDYWSWFYNENREQSQYPPVFSAIQRKWDRISMKRLTSGVLGKATITDEQMGKMDSFRFTLFEKLIWEKNGGKISNGIPLEDAGDSSSEEDEESDTSIPYWAPPSSDDEAEDRDISRDASSDASSEFFDAWGELGA